MELPPEPDPTDPWQLLRLKAKILGDDIRRAREELTQAQGNRAVLVQAERAQQRALRALSSLIYPPA
jgi:hypothetical protein